MYRAAEALIEAGLAYVDEQTPEQMRATAATSPRPAPTIRSAAARRPRTRRAFREMRDGRHADGSMVLRAKIDMASPNINLRDPAIYRIKHAEHHNTGNRWCIYPMYTVRAPDRGCAGADHHSICTLEFEDQRPFYDWLLGRLPARLLRAAAAAPVRVRAAERHLRHHQQAQAPTGRRGRSSTAGTTRACRPSSACAGAATRPEAIRLMCERAGTSKAGGWTDYASLDIALRGPRRQRRRARGRARAAETQARRLGRGVRQRRHRASRHAPRTRSGRSSASAASRRFGPELWIDREDFAETPPKGFFRLFPATGAAESTALVVECTGCEGRRRPSRRCSPASCPTRAAARRAPTGQGQGHHHLGRRVRRACRSTAPVRPPFTDPADAGGGTSKASLNPPARRSSRGFVDLRWRWRPDSMRAVRAPRLLRHRPRGPRGGPAGVQPDHDAERHLGGPHRLPSMQVRFLPVRLAS